VPLITENREDIEEGKTQQNEQWAGKKKHGTEGIYMATELLHPWMKNKMILTIT